jgi:hypothetical protein
MTHLKILNGKLGSITVLLDKLLEIVKEEFAAYIYV